MQNDKPKFKMNVFTSLATLTLILLISNCQKNKNILESSSGISERIKLSYSKEDTIEAAEFGLWLSGELSVADSLVSELLYNLNYLRAKYAESFPVIDKDNRFLPPWAVSQVACKVDSITNTQINNNQYKGWNQLSPSLRLDTIISYPDDIGWCLLGFNEMYHPARLSEIYSHLPGFLVCEPNFIIFGGFSGFPFFPRLVGESISYVYPEPPGMAHTYYYFKYEGDEPQFIGKWNRVNEAEPDWWAEAKLNIENFDNWDGYNSATGFLIKN